MSYEPVLIYMTTADLNEAERLGELLLQKRLVACVNLPQGGMISMFHWQDQLDHSKEQLMLAKSTRDHLPAIQQSLKNTILTNVLVCWLYQSWVVTHPF